MMRISIFYCLFIFFISTECHAVKKNAPWVGVTLENFRCSGRQSGVGPYDYNQRKSLGSKYQLVVSAHFREDQKNLIKGRRGPLHQDIDYTLRAIPNHHDALLSVIRYEIKRKNNLVKGKLSSQPECYIQRAMNFTKKDPVPYMLYGYYLRKMGKPKQAIQHYEKSLNLAPKSAKIEYSYSLLLIDLKRYDQAFEHAKKAYQLGNPPNSLRNKLIKLGQWK